MFEQFKVWSSKHPVAFALVLIALVASAAVGVVAAVSIVLVDSNHISGTPLTPTPTPLPTASPTQTVAYIGATLTANATTIYKGDTIHLTATLNVTAPGVNVQLWNLGEYKETKQTDANGEVTWDRAPTVAYDYYVRVENSVP